MWALTVAMMEHLVLVLTQQTRIGPGSSVSQLGQEWNSSVKSGLCLPCATGMIPASAYLMVTCDV